MHTIVIIETSAMAFRLAVLSVLSIQLASGSSHLSRLYADLFAKYNADVIPMADDNQPLLLKSSFFLTSIRDVDSKSQTITINGWIKVLWTDASLMWDPDLYGNVSVINVPNTKIWTPDIVFFNGVGQVFFDTTGYMKTRVYHTGSVEFEPGGELTLLCLLNMQRFPFDMQVCSLQVAPWSYTDNQVNVVAVRADIAYEQFTANGEWDIVNLWMFNSSYTSDNGNFTQAEFHFRTRRHPLFQLFTMLVPVVLLALLNLFVFRLPVEDGEKINFACGLLLADSVWLIQLIQTLPMNSGSIPLMGLYVIILMMIISLSIVATVYVIHVHWKFDSEPIPQKLQAFCIWYQQRSCSAQCLTIRKTKPVQLNHLKSPVTLDWKMVARQLDSILFYICSAAVVGVSLGIGVAFIVIKDGGEMS